MNTEKSFKNKCVLPLGVHVTAQHEAQRVTTKVQGSLEVDDDRPPKAKKF